ncbi:MAG: DNA (cytosine-5-)-methyltransferase [Mycoplasmatales bacterium]
MKIRLFEAFAGIGSQHTAFSKLAKKKEYNFEFELAGLSEWNVYSVVSYMNINGIKYIKSGYSKEDLVEYLGRFNYSIDGKNVAKNLNSVSYDVLDRLFYAHSKLKNIPNIQNLRGDDIIKKDVNVFTYSFPCQDLSVAGKQKGMKKGANTRSGLLWEVERILLEISVKDRSKLPKYLLMENVPQIVNSNHKKDYEMWKSFLNELGYKTIDGMINSLDIGFPQSRNRFFAISILDYDGNIDLEKKIFDHISEFDEKCKNIDKIKKKYTLAKCIKTKKDCSNEKNGDKYFNELLAATPNHTESRLKMFENEKQLTISEDKVIKTKQNQMKAHCCTITTKQDRWNNAGIIHFHGKILNDGTKSKFRYITPREAFMLMGFSEKQFDAMLEIDITLAEQYKMAGNSIVVPVLEQIFETFIISDYLEKWWVNVK